MRIALVVMMLICGVTVYAESPRQINPPKGIESKQATNKQHYGTEEFPFIVKTVKPPKTKEETDSDADDRNDRKALNNFTLALVVVGTLQFIALILQVIFLCKTLGATNKAANAAKESAEALPKIERAYIFAAVGFDNSGVLTVELENHGRTPAILKSMCATRTLNTTPPQEFDNRHKSHIPDGIVIANGKPWPAVVTPDISKEEWELIEGTQFTLFCYGVVEYKDILSQRRNTGFCWQLNYEDGMGRWIIADSKLNYYDKYQD